MAQKANYAMLGFFNLTTCLLKCEGMQVRIQEMLITKDKKTLWKVFNQPKYEYQKQNPHVYIAYQFTLGYPVFVDAMVLQENLVHL